MRWGSEGSEFGEKSSRVRRQSATAFLRSFLCAFAREKCFAQRRSDMHKKRYLITLLLGPLTLASVIAHAQTPPKQDEDVVKVKSNLVNIDVIVKDKKGKYISDLKAEDFAITENGQPQKVEFFDAPLARKSGEPGVDSPAPATAPRNYVSLVLDYQTTDITNLKQVREGAIKYV